MTKDIVRHTMLLIFVISLLACAKGSGTSSSASVKLETEDQKTLYALGLMVGSNVKPFALTPEELEIVKAGVTDVVNNAKPQVELDTYGPKVQDLHTTRVALGAKERELEADDAKKKGEEFAANVAKEKDTTKTASGIVIRTITAGTGPSPAATDVVKVHYEGKLIDGTVFDSSVERGEPVEFPLNGVVPCWTEAVQTMKKGGKAQIVCPSDTAYGNRGEPPTIPPGATLSFEVELLDFKKQ